MKRRDFLLGGAAVGAIAGAGVVVPLALVFANDEDLAAGIDGVAIEHFERRRVGSLDALGNGEPQYFDYPLAGQSNIMVDLGERAIGGIGEDRSVVAFSEHLHPYGLPRHRLPA